MGLLWHLLRCCLSQADEGSFPGQDGQRSLLPARDKRLQLSQDRDERQLGVAFTSQCLQASTAGEGPRALLLCPQLRHLLAPNHSSADIQRAAPKPLRHAAGVMGSRRDEISWPLVRSHGTWVHVQYLRGPVQAPSVVPVGNRGRVCILVFFSRYFSIVGTYLTRHAASNTLPPPAKYWTTLPSVETLHPSKRWST